MLMPNHQAAQEATQKESLTLNGQKLCIQFVVSKIFMAPVSRFNVVNLYYGLINNYVVHLNSFVAH